MIGGTILLILALVFWFVMSEAPSDDSATMFVRVFKSIFGVKGYAVTIKVLAVILFCASLFEYYKYFTVTS
ncbi:hypothetical protein KIM67_10600 [Flagellimonas sp. 389]|uniref:hypothetical protein n=1 Tax=Flagellimonas sp. 389 TaxID=2835862 RepID=UPI001BD68395|nr:hypothetical protein [Flagellimonas sp. 389]MBS9462862.1 hypothetical protein [Flagellimonas sp. 389]